MCLQSPKQAGLCGTQTRIPEDSNQLQATMYNLKWVWKATRVTLNNTKISVATQTGHGQQVSMSHQATGQLQRVTEQTP